MPIKARLRLSKVFGMLSPTKPFGLFPKNKERSDYIF